MRVARPYQAVMPPMRPVLYASVPAFILALVLTACGTTPPVRHYTLGPLAPLGVAPEAGPAGIAGASLVVGPVSVPAAIDRLHIVRLLDGARADVADGHRWAAPLKTEIAAMRVIGIQEPLPTSAPRGSLWFGEVTLTRDTKTTLTRNRQPGVDAGGMKA